MDLKGKDCEGADWVELRHSKPSGGLMWTV